MLLVPSELHQELEPQQIAHHVPQATIALLQLSRQLSVSLDFAQPDLVIQRLVLLEPMQLQPDLLKLLTVLHVLKEISVLSQALMLLMAYVILDFTVMLVRLLQIPLYVLLEAIATWDLTKRLLVLLELLTQILEASLKLTVKHALLDTTVLEWQEEGTQVKLENAMMGIIALEEPPILIKILPAKVITLQMQPLLHQLKLSVL